MRNHDRAAFTLLEVAAALALVGFVLLGVRLLLDALDDGRGRIVVAAHGDATRRNGLRLLRQLVRDAEPTLDSTAQLRGDAASVEYGSWCAEPQGWSARCHVRLTIDSTGDSSVVIADLSTGEHLVLERLLGGAAFLYFDPLRADSVWQARWAAGATLPLALGIAAQADTALYGLGPSRD